MVSTDESSLMEVSTLFQELTSMYANYKRILREDCGIPVTAARALTYLREYKTAINKVFLHLFTDAASKKPVNNPGSVDKTQHEFLQQLPFELIEMEQHIKSLHLRTCEVNCEQNHAQFWHEQILNPLTEYTKRLCSIQAKYQ